MQELQPPASTTNPDLASPLAGDAPRRPGRWRTILTGWPIRAALSLGLVLYLGANLDWRSVMQIFAAADKWLVAMAFVPLAVTPLLVAERWRHAAVASNIRLSRRFFVPALYAALFAGQVLPSSIGVDAVRLALLWRQKIPLRNAFQSVALDRMAGVSALVLLMYAGLPFAIERLPPGTSTPIALITGLMAACGAVALFVDRLPLPLLLRRGWGGRVLSFVTEIRAAIGTPQAVAALAYGVAVHLLSVLTVYLLAEALGYDLRYRDLLTVTAVAVFAGLLPISFNGWGVREGAMMLGLSLLAVPRDIALMISFMYGVGVALSCLPGCVSWFHLRHAHEEQVVRRSMKDAIDQPSRIRE